MKKAGILIALFLVSIGVSAQNKTDRPGISVNGIGIVNVTPDQVLINVGVSHEGDTAKEVKNKTDKDIDAVLNFLKTEKIASKNIKTEYLNLNKRYDHSSKSDRFYASQSISIKLEDITKYETVISGLMQSGINRINGVAFESSKIELYKTQARKKAIQNAREKAETYADALQQEVGKAFRVSEMNNYNGGSPVYKAMQMEANSSSGNQRNTLAVGEMEIKVEIAVSFILR
ncbi:SIMPL domain-containing protein [Haloflavibacter putidus]|uniref:DUF541 domain-containing protein n=1 Tax=Haloflavibacter putidus TaxID=2576776 RepID=A0A508A0N0_9FLAO|nr:SIMPL domain-containing protein [Haloflavibacter putidus]TQD39382.1 DUF541 domain-containing protein [Haloflavibacter putidus]